MAAVIKLGDDTPWTCGDSQTAIEQGEPLGHTEILIPIYVDEEIIAYMPWEPLAGVARSAELRRNIERVCDAFRGER